MWRSKSGPLWFGEELVPVVHGRDPRAAWTAPQQAKAAARVGGACGPTGASGCRSGAFCGFLFSSALLEAEAFAVHFQDMDVVGQAVQQRPRQAF